MHRADAILVVDDNPDHADLLATLLRVKGFEVVAVYGPGQGLAAPQARRFAVVLTDYHMPIKTGCAMLAEAKAAGLLEHTEVMVVTSAPLDVVGWRAVSKLIDVDILIAEIKELLAALTRRRGVTT